MLGRILCTICLIGVAIHGSVGQSVDRQLQKLSWRGEDLSAFASLVTEGAQTDREKLTRIYQWIIYHIRYDYEALRDGNWRINRNSQDILLRGKAICWGYATLCKTLLGEVDIQAVVVSGYSRGLPSSGQDSQEPDHAWNAVQVDDEWYLVDATWDSGILHAMEDFDATASHYFLSEPAEFLQSHIPAQPMWQLLACPVGLVNFIERGVNYIAEDDSCYAYSDSIAAYLQLDTLERLLYEAEVQYRFHPTDANQDGLAHTLIDYAVSLKEEGDAWAAEGMDSLATNTYQTALDYFERAGTIVDFYSWQQEAYAFCHLNLSQRLYAVSGTDYELQTVVFHMKQAGQLLQEISPSTPMIQNALEMIKQNLEMLK